MLIGRRHWFVAVALVMIGCSRTGVASTSDEISLAGVWNVHLDPDEVFLAPADLPTDSGKKVDLPGSLAASDVGEPGEIDSDWIGSKRASLLHSEGYLAVQDPNHFRHPFQWQAKRRYVGVAWYQRNFVVRDEWVDQVIELSLERPHFRTRVWVDDIYIGSNDSISTPHRFAWPPSFDAGEHRLTIRVDNRIDHINVGQNAHSISDHTQTAWHGIVGDLRLRRKPGLRVEDVRITTLDDPHRLRISGVVHADAPESTDRQLRLRAIQADRTVAEGRFAMVLRRGTTRFSHELELAHDAVWWNEFNPVTCNLQIDLCNGDRAFACRNVEFGIRTVSTRDRDLLINGRSVFLRGTLECCVFPKTGYPPTDVESWRTIFARCKTSGLNHVRFHSWCPPEAAFVAADEAGIYLQVECGAWIADPDALGRGEAIDDWLHQEADAILRTYGNHPSLIILAASNEPIRDKASLRYLNSWSRKQADPRVMVTAGVGWPRLPHDQIHVMYGPRLQRWGEGLSSFVNTGSRGHRIDYRRTMKTVDKPVISHEVGQWCVFPNLDVAADFDGLLSPTNLEIIRRRCEKAGLLDQVESFEMASGKLQQLLYKEEIETLLRTEDLAGFQLLGMTDFPGQGTAPVGLFDPFWRPKRYFDAEAWRQCCSPVVPLVRLHRRTLTSGQTIRGTAMVAWHWERPATNIQATWRIDCGNETIAEGKFETTDAPDDGLIPLGEIRVDVGDVAEPQRWKLTITVTSFDSSLPSTCAIDATTAHREDQPSKRFCNQWDLWVYPAASNTVMDKTDDLLVTRKIDDQMIRHLRDGRTVLLTVDPIHVRSQTKTGFSSIFWNTVWTNGQAPQTLGIHCDPKHPAFDGFPTSFHSDWQWSEVLVGATPLELERLPRSVAPLIGLVPDWANPKRLGLAIEATVGGGKLLMTSIDFQRDMSQRPAAGQLLASLRRYVGGDRFKPTVALEIDQVKSLIHPRRAVAKLAAVAISPNEADTNPADAAIDGDPNTFWHTQYRPVADGIPHHIILDLRKPIAVAALQYVPRSTGALNGRIRGFRVEVSFDGEAYETVCRGSFTRAREFQTATFDRPRIARYVRLTPITHWDGGTHTSVAELDVVLASQH